LDNSVFSLTHTQNADGTTLTAYVSTHHIHTMYGTPDARSRVWTRTTVLDRHGGVCVTTYRQGSPAPNGNSIHRAYALPSNLDHFLSHLRRLEITCHLHLTINSCTPSITSRDTSKPICLWLRYCC